MTSTPVTASPTMSTFTPPVPASTPRLTRRTAGWLLAGVAVVLVVAATGIGYRAHEASSTPTTRSGQGAASLSDQGTSAHGTLGGVRTGTGESVSAGGATAAVTPLPGSSSDAALLVHGGPGSLTRATGHRVPVDR